MAKGGYIDRELMGQPGVGMIGAGHELGEALSAGAAPPVVEPQRILILLVEADRALEQKLRRQGDAIARMERDRRLVPAGDASVVAVRPDARRQPVDELGKLCHEFDTLLLLDTVTSLGGVPVEVDGWGVDAVYSGTQKCLSCPPGLAPSLGMTPGTTTGPSRGSSTRSSISRAQYWGSWRMSATL